MNRIRLLPEQVANQIAAGEVVERPASVVKELVENALDAKATRITVEIQAGGRSLVRVTDDGTGMSRDDALLCLERHATSKIRKAEDLAAIATMGFRGEALPSIASVSRFVLTTREAESDSPEGTQVVINGGKILEVKAAGSAPGTTLEVRQLFFNLPARRKFMRTEETESAHIQHYLTLAALSSPEVGFAFIKDGRQVWQLPPVKCGAEIPSRLTALRERLRALFGDEQKLLAVNFRSTLRAGQENEDGVEPETEFRLWGYIGGPGVSRSTREDQNVFVNRRPVENRGLNYALMEGYHTSLMKGRYPVCCLFLEMDPAAVDVNIHPAKREVKFHREAEVRRLVAQAVRETLLAFHSAPAGAGTTARPSPRLAASRRRETPGAPAPAASEPALPNFPAALSPARRCRRCRTAQPSLNMGFGAPPSAKAVPQPSERIGRRSDELQPPAAPAGVALPPAPAAARAPGSPVPLLQVPLRLIGVVGRLYVLLESDRGLVLLDQHAAHERILFEQMLNRLEKKEMAPSQKLLLPATVELSARDAVFPSRTFGDTDAAGGWLERVRRADVPAGCAAAVCEGGRSAPVCAGVGG